MSARPAPRVSSVGITDYAQGELGDVVFVNMPKVGDKFAHQAFGTIEAVKAVSDLYSPLAGEVTEVNGALEPIPPREQVPYEKAWMIRLKATNPASSTRCSPPRPTGPISAPDPEDEVSLTPRPGVEHSGAPSFLEPDRAKA